jgi:16S rRNA (uracil1498-N3)-methyltransferase
MRVVAATRRELGFEITGPARFEPGPGAPEAPLPWVEVAVAWPRRTRAEEMVRRLTQLGAARITPLVARQAGPQKPPEADDPRWMRVLRDSCKQSGRAWLPQLVAPLSPAELALARPQASLAVLDPARGRNMDTWARALLPSERGLGTPERPIVLIVGPEGGFDDDERQNLGLRGATSVRVAPHILRVETAAEDAMAIAASCWMRASADDVQI